MNWEYFILGMIAYQVAYILIQVVRHATVRHREKNVLRLVDIKFPGKPKITFIAIDASDRRAMIKLERQIRDQYNLPESEVQDLSGDRPGDAALRRAYLGPPAQDLFGDLEFDADVRRRDPEHRQDSSG